MRKTMLLLLVCLLSCSCVAHASSWNQISESVVTSEDWQRFTETPQFSLGDTNSIGLLSDGSPLLSQDFDDYPRLDGSTVAVPMGMEIARQHLSVDEADLPAFVSFTTTHNAYVNLINRLPGATMSIYSAGISMDESHAVDLILATEPSTEELALAADADVTLVTEPFCLDAFIFITHIDNPVDSLTTQQVKDIYAGRITNWSEVGGTDAEIIAYLREKNSGSQTAMEQLVMHGEAFATDRAPHLYIPAMSDLIQVIGEQLISDVSIGYTYQYYLENLYTNTDIKTLAIDGIQPTPENLRSGAYPYTTHYFAVYRADDENGPAGRMAAWLLTDEGQQSVRQAGYVSLRDVEK